MQLTRRRLVVSATVVAATGLATGCRGAAARQRAARRLASIHGEPEARRAIGRRYLAGRHAAIAPSDYADDLYGDLGWFARYAADEPLRQRVSERILEDFRVGRVESVDGWRLSATEARLCALVFLLDEAAETASGTDRPRPRS